MNFTTFQHPVSKDYFYRFPITFNIGSSFYSDLTFLPSDVLAYKKDGNIFEVRSPTDITPAIEKLAEYLQELTEASHH